MHLIVLHDSAGSGNPLGVSGNPDRLPFAPYFLFKDLITIFIFILALSIFVFYMPNVLGDSENYVMANAMQTPPAIVPEWYLLPFYAILRSIPNKLLGVIAMFSAILILLTMPFTDLSKTRGIQFRPLSKVAFFIFIGNFLILMQLGAKHVESPFIEFGQISTALYFAHFLLIVPLITLIENSLTELASRGKTDIFVVNSFAFEWMHFIANTSVAKSSISSWFILYLKFVYKVILHIHYKWDLNKPPKPHALVNLPLRSGMDSLVEWVTEVDKLVSVGDELLTKQVEYQSELKSHMDALGYKTVSDTGTGTGYQLVPSGKKTMYTASPYISSSEIMEKIDNMKNIAAQGNINHDKWSDNMQKLADLSKDENRLNAKSVPDVVARLNEYASKKNQVCWPPKPIKPSDLLTSSVTAYTKATMLMITLKPKACYTFTPLLTWFKYFKRILGAAVLGNKANHFRCFGLFYFAYTFMTRALVYAVYSCKGLWWVLDFTNLSKTRGIQFRPLSKIAFFIFIGNFLILMQLGAKHVESPFIEFGQISTALYFAHFLLIVPLVSLIVNRLIELAAKRDNSSISNASSFANLGAAPTHIVKSGVNVKFLYNCLKQLCWNLNSIPKAHALFYCAYIVLQMQISAGFAICSCWGSVLGLGFTTAICDAPRPWGLYFQDSGTPQMEGLVELHDNIFFFLVIILFGVGCILAFIIKSYKGVESPISHKYSDHGTLIELIWTITPGLILILVAFPSFKLLYLMDEVSDPSMAILAEGHQWYWSFQYPDFLNSDDEFIEFDSYLVPESDLEDGALRMLEVDSRLIIPELTHVRFIVTGADVIHSFACPALGIKCDAYPGRLNQVSVMINREGTFFGQCSEICGILHSSMPIVIESVSIEKFVAWLLDQ